ncbi:FeoA family protein [Deinococcus multiflagellatus]|uniref:Ferrous iron transport protein A n=1 Tax=Deinococcus multiflagellatus TaxID=1656887 RepID=A0ABW1ZP92_9DEIO|nr:FeoA domain-containing protein [Deinococcus multiflagellatus]MBZ9713994.1 FeoA domain-containing protein [Deinococcus multiflagellatus]
MPDVSLDTLRPGDSAHIVSVDSAHPLRRRLTELGFVRGAPVTVIRRAPMGDPVQLRLGGALLALRAADLRLIQVRA